MLTLVVECVPTHHEYGGGRCRGPISMKLKDEGRCLLHSGTFLSISLLFSLISNLHLLFILFIYGYIFLSLSFSLFSITITQPLTLNHSFQSLSHNHSLSITPSLSVYFFIYLYCAKKFAGHKTTTTNKLVYQRNFAKKNRASVKAGVI